MRASLQSALELLYQPGSMSSAPCELLEQHGILLLVPHQHKKEAYRQLLAAEAMKQDFLEAAGVLQERQIPFVPIKGLMLAHLLYGDYAVRGSSDIDLAIPLEYHEQAIGSLTQAGNTHSRSAYQHKTVEVLTCRKNGTTLELHFALSTAELFSGFAAEFWQDQDEVVFEGRAFACLSKEVHLIYLMIHLARHMEELRAVWIEDVRRFLVKFGPALDWDRFLDLARKHRLANVLLLTMTYCNRVFLDFGQTVCFPREVVDEIRRRQTLHGRMIYRYLLPRLESHAMTSWSRRIFSFSLIEDWHERMFLIKEFLLRRLLGKA
ncbi:MAG: hypothetical protein DMF51_17690 [Acidobacteria bacterium]|nr:MAG: hypothetical protein DMF51_17690 [Acidobacteriota bacterium]